MAKKFLLGKAPFVRRIDEGGVSTTRMMMDVLIALMPITVFAWVKNGLMPFIKTPGVSVLTMIYPLLFVIAGGLISFLLEAIYFYSFMKIRDPKKLVKTVLESFAVVPGVILALILPLNTPIVVLVFGCFLANIVFKMLFGGFGKNVFNPALIAYAILMVSFSVTNSYFNPTEVISATTSATPLTNLGSQSAITYDAVVAPYGNLWNFFIGTVPGVIGETSGLLCLVGFIYLVVRKVINWRVPVIYVSTVFVVTAVIAIVNDYGMWYPVFNVLSGGLLFGAVFMATEPVTTPKNPNGKVLFALGCGVLTCLFRLVGMYPEGVATSILFMCLFTPVIDRFVAKIRSSAFSYKTVLKYGAVVLLFVLIAVYTVIKCTPDQQASDLVRVFGGIR